MLSVDVTIDRSDFSLRVRQDLDARVTGVFGPSGAGKSTLLGLLAGLQRTGRGRIELDGEVLHDTTRRAFVPPHRRRIGMVFQDARLLPHLTVEGNLRYGYRLTPRRLRRFDLSTIADMLEISQLLKRGVADLSGGEKQRVALGRAILTSPRLLLLDEPFAALDTPLKQQIIPCLARVLQVTGIPALLVSHRLEELLSFTDRLLLLKAGAVAGHGAYRDLVLQRDPARLLCAGGLTNVLHLPVDRHCPGSGLTYLSWPLGPDPHRRRAWLRAPYTPGLRPGETVRIALAGHDIALSMAPVETISMQNRLPGVIREVVSVAGRTVVIVDAGRELMVEVTSRARQEFDLRPGMRIWCLFKTQALQRIGGEWITDGQPTPNARPAGSGEIRSPRCVRPWGA
jgi:molybdate transport system ATP-binding protein